MYYYYPSHTGYPVQYIPVVQPSGGYSVQVNPTYNRQQYPDVDADLFFKSANAFKILMADASKILNRLSEDEKLAYDIMNAAQQNQLEKVEEMIQSTGVQGDVEVEYNPDGINLVMISQVEGSDCCKLTMALRWR